MKGLKNSLKKLSITFSFRDSIQKSESIENAVDLETKREFYRQSIAKIVQYKGYEFPEDAVHIRVLENIEDFEVRDDDVFLVSYPACGGHLLEDIVLSMINQNLLNNGLAKTEEEKDESNSVARLEASNLYGHIRWLKSLKSPRVISTSLPYDLLPKQMQTPNAKLIYMARNVKDHIVAYYYHHRLKGVQLSFDEFIELYINGYLLYGNYFDHVVSFWQLSQLYSDNVLFICYEEMKLITPMMAELIAQFLNLNLQKQEIEEILANKQGTTNVVNSEDLKKFDSDPTAAKLNKFQSILGDWTNYFNPEQLNRVDRVIKMKFRQQKLNLISDVVVALRHIEKHGRLIVIGQETIKTKHDDHVSQDLTLSKKSSLFKKRPILTKDEAIFIRKKDKVVIIEENIDEPKPSFVGRALSCLLGCCLSHRKKKNYTVF